MQHSAPNPSTSYQEAQCLRPPETGHSFLASPRYGGGILYNLSTQSIRSAKRMRWILPATADQKLQFRCSTAACSTMRSIVSSSRSHLSIVRVLLDHGLNMDVVGGPYWRKAERAAKIVAKADLLISQIARWQMPCCLTKGLSIFVIHHTILIPCNSPSPRLIADPVRMIRRVVSAP